MSIVLCLVWYVLMYILMWEEILRVISGSARGHKLKCIQGMNTRPTQDRVKESVFNIIMDCIDESIVLDLFSGTGNLGIEALSRGAKFSVMVENSFSCVQVIKENLIHTKLNDKAKVINMDVIMSLKSLNQKFDLIFMDPPYNKNLIIPTLNEIYSNEILSDNGLIIIERSVKDDISGNLFSVLKEKKYGDTIVSFLQKDLK